MKLNVKKYWLKMFTLENDTFLSNYVVSVDKLKLSSFYGKIPQNVQIWYKAIRKSESLCYKNWILNWQMT